MAKSNWVTVGVLAKELNLKSTMVVTNWVARGSIKSKKHPEYGITLVDKTTAPTVKTTVGRPKKDTK